MPELPFAPPSAVACAIATMAVLAAGFARCGGSGAPVAKPATSAPNEPASRASVAEAPVPASETASAAPPPSAPAEKHRYAIAAIGDSLTDAKSNGGKYLDYVAKKCPESRIYNYGKGGDMVNQMRRRFQDDLFGTGSEKKPQYTHLIVFGGVNDLYSDLSAGRNPDKISIDLSFMYEMARRHGMRVVAITVAPWGGFKKYFNPSRSAATLKLNDWIRAQLEQKTVDYVVDAYPLLSCGNAEELCPEVATPYKDGLHFGPVGHEKIGAALFEKVFSDCA
jgi:lysophospholipase L1-like esterase